MNHYNFTERSVFYSPNKIIFGLNTTRGIAEEVKALEGKKVLIVTDKVMIEMEVIRPLIDALEAAEIPYAIYDDVLPSAPARLMIEALAQLESEGCDLVIGFGGGSALDTAKGVSLMATNGTNIQDMLGYHKVKKRGTPKIMLSTTNNAGADVGFAIVTLTDEETHEHGVIVSNYAMPDVTITDPLLTFSMPTTVTVDTGIDVLVTGVESLVSKKATPFSDPYAEKVLSMCVKYLPVAYAKGSDLEARYHMSLAATMSGLAYMSSGLGAVHGLSYPIAGACHLTHGRSMGAILPHVMRFNLSGNPERYSRVATIMGKNTEGLSTLAGSKLAIEAVEEMLDAIDVSYRLHDYGLVKEEIPALAEKAVKRVSQISFPSNPRDFTIDDVKNIYEAAY